MSIFHYTTKSTLNRWISPFNPTKCPCTLHKSTIVTKETGTRALNNSERTLNAIIIQIIPDAMSGYGNLMPYVYPIRTHETHGLVVMDFPITTQISIKEKKTIETCSVILDN